MLQLAVAAREADYIRRLADYVRDSPFGAEWRLTGFTSAASLRQFLKGGYRIDLLVMQPEFRQATEGLADGVPTVLLAGAGPVQPDAGTVTGAMPGGGAGAVAAMPAVRQFQPLPSLMKELEEIHRAAAGAMPAFGAVTGETCVAAVCSALGGIGKTTLAVQLASLAAAARMRAFYLNLEVWNASGLVFGSGEDDAFPRLLYTLQAEPQQAAALLAKLKRRHPSVGADYVPGAPNPGERLALSPDVFRRLIDTIAGSAEYDLVVIDTDGVPDELFAAVLERSTRIVWLTADTPVAKRKTDIALRYGRLRWGEAWAAAERRTGFVTVGLPSGGPPEPASLPFVGRWADSGGVRPGDVPPAYRAAVQSLLAALLGREVTGDARGHRVGAAGAARFGAQPD